MERTYVCGECRGSCTLTVDYGDLPEDVILSSLTPTMVCPILPDGELDAHWLYVDPDNPDGPVEP